MPTLADLLVDFGSPKARKPAFDLPAQPAFTAPAEFSFPGLSVEPMADGPEDAGALSDGSFELPQADFAAPPALELPDTDAIVAEAVEKAEAELRERLETEFIERLEAERSEHAAQVARLEARIGEAAGAHIAEQFDSLQHQLTAYTGDVVARLLAPVLTEELQRRAVTSLASLVAEALRHSGAVRVRVRGPLSMFEALEARLGEHAGRVEYTEAEGLDLQVGIDESLYETRLSEWSKSLAEAVP